MSFLVVCISQSVGLRDEPPRARLGRDEAPPPRVHNLDNKARPTVIFPEIEMAEEEAKKQAALNPQKQYAVMGIVRVFETAAPTFITKAMNVNGELVLEKTA